MYSLHQALESIKEEIEGYEEEMKKMSGYAREEQREIMLWCFERGISILKLAKKGEIKQEIIDWFLGRTKEKPFDTQKEAMRKIKENGINENWFDRFFRD